MSLSEKALQLDLVADETSQQVNLGAAIQACEDAATRAQGIIGDLPAGGAAQEVWMNARTQVEAAAAAVAAAVNKTREIAQAVRNAGAGG
jgi:hypothetical protein